VGVVPYYTNIYGASQPLEQFRTQQMFDFGTFAMDDYYGSFWMEWVYLTMPDPFWQKPFKPDCNVVAPDSVLWTEDDGSGIADTETDTGSGTVYYKHFAHHPLVEALASLPSGATLPSGVTLPFDPASHTFPPPFYPNGIPIGDVDGNYAGHEQDWGFSQRACGNVGGRFSAQYAYVPC